MPVLLQLPDVPVEYADRLDGECEWRKPRSGELAYSVSEVWEVATCNWGVCRPCYRLKPAVKYITPDNAYALAHPQCECEVSQSLSEKWEPGHKLLAVVDGCSFRFCSLTPSGCTGWWSKCRVKV